MNKEMTARHTGAAAPMARWQWVCGLVLIGLLAAALRYDYLTTAMVFHPLRGDAGQYHAYAWNLIHHGVFSQAAPGSAVVIPDNFRDPGYPALLAVLATVTADEDMAYALALLAQGALGALTVVLLMLAARGWLPDRWTMGAGVTMALWPHTVVMNSFLLSETLLGFLVALALCLLASALKRGRASWGAASGLAFGAAALTNAVLLPFGPLLAAIRRPWSRVAFALLAGSLALPAAWAIRNSQLPPPHASSSQRAIMNLVQGSWPDYQSSYLGARLGDPRATQVQADIQHEIDVSVAQPFAGLAMIARRLASQPGHYFAWYLSKPLLLWSWSMQLGASGADQGDLYVYATANSPYVTRAPFRAFAAICKAINPLTVVFALAGCVIAWRQRREAPMGWAMAVLLLYVTIVYSVLQAEPRYSIPFRGVELLMATSALHQAVVWLAAKRQIPAEASGS